MSVIALRTSPTARRGEIPRKLVRDLLAVSLLVEREPVSARSRLLAALGREVTAAVESVLAATPRRGSPAPFRSIGL